ncbi:PQQ-dependent sugar dehydrogenase [Cryobacterium sp. PH29-G1]|uniref:PQQ-dependent sugar dehydrogenase n=1 Tax=Cryobacterium sp. PH29-G1 TaxID=3046211 RepID=UPI0024BA50D8|nr:PQQ-dependent sugar dehydrogenase [Cryobacterium sp. PH29-G1]MDJ0347726.1 PQQ-dependent sugar dehydrogenase [Cryobacterium sp. PH29-G1]
MAHRALRFRRAVITVSPLPPTPAQLRTAPGVRGLTRLRMVTALSTATALIILTLAACSAEAPNAAPATERPAQPTPTQLESGTNPLTPVQPVGDPVVIASGLAAPWSILRLPSGATLISERDTARVRELLPDGSLREVGTVEAAQPNGEGGLLGLAFLADTAAPGGDGWVYAYLSTATDNRIERMPLAGSNGGHTLGAPDLVLDSIPRAGNHNGGRIAFGPDGLLYATVGDAGNPATAQDLDALGGKILRMTPTGDVPIGSEANPFDTLVYSYGHRNPQGIAWDSHGQLWSSEFGQNTWDELNRIVPGGNYGWPTVEGQAGDARFIDPEQQWSTADASPSGLVIVSDTIFLASLRGSRLWSIPITSGSTGGDSSTGAPTAWFVNRYGRLRDVVSGPAGTLWFVSNNTDGRGSPVAGDDRLYQVHVRPVSVPAAMVEP